MQTNNRLKKRGFFILRFWIVVNQSATKTIPFSCYYQESNGYQPDEIYFE
jgi:hypothetical protein